MKRKLNFSTCLKLYAGVTALAVFLLGFTDVNAQSFSETNFTVVNNSGSGYEANFDNNSHRYRLTGEIPGQSTAMWYNTNTQIDLRNDFLIDFKLNFGDSANGADGFVFVMHQLNTSGLIGNSGQYIGYGRYTLPPVNGIPPPPDGTTYSDTTIIIDTNNSGSGNTIQSILYTPSVISPSFGIEFDTYYNEYVDTMTENHISFLRNAVMESTLEYEIQNNKRSVETNQDYCVRIVWKKDTTGGYTLTVSGITKTIKRNGTGSYQLIQLKIIGLKFMKQIFIGIDFPKETFDVTIISRLNIENSLHSQFSNSKEGCNKF